MKIVGLDQGTTSTRALVCGDGATTIALALRHRQMFPQPGWVEHDPRELLDNVVACLSACGDGVDAIGLANQGESCLAWDAETKAAISPVIVWQDNRTHAAMEKLRAAGHEEIALTRSGLPLDPYFSASKLRWILEHCPEARAAASAGRLRLGTTDAFFLDNLTGDAATDATTASRTGLMNIQTGAWDETLCDLFGVPLECLPEIKPTIGAFGVWNGAPVSASIVDQQAALFGHGCRKRGNTKITFGTGAFALAVTEERIVSVRDAGLLPTIAWRRGDTLTRAAEGGVYDAGSALEWAKRLGLYSREEELQSFEDSPAIARGLVFVPALSGLGAPHWDRSAAGLWLGMSGAASKADLRQSILEGVALRMTQVIDALDRETGVADTLPIDGGLSGSPYFCQFLADMLDRRIVVGDNAELTAFGAAQLAAEAIGAELKRPAKNALRYEPRPIERTAFKARFADALSRCRDWRS